MFPIQTVEHCANLYVVMRNIGRGSFGNVYKLKDNLTQTDVAGKFILIKENYDEERIRKEIIIIASLHHENIVQYLSSYSSPNGYVIVTKYYSGKTLCDRRLKQNIEERDVILYVTQICKALKYMHQRHNIIHRDIKPSNVVCESEDSKHVRIIDFGMSCKLDDENIIQTCGTRKYLAPEVLRSGPITSAVDMWSLGVMTYWLLTVSHPFPDIFEVVNLASGWQYTHNAQLSEVVSDTGRDFINNLFIVQPELRLTASAALQHSWLLTLNNDPSSTPD